MPSAAPSTPVSSAVMPSGSSGSSAACVQLPPFQCCGSVRDTCPVLRRSRTTKLARQARAIGRLGQLRHPAAVGLRDRLVRLVPLRAAMRGLDDVLAWQPSSSTARDQDLP